MSSTPRRKLPLKRSMKPFCMGRPGSMKSSVMPLRSAHSASASAMNSGPLSRRSFGGITTPGGNAFQRTNDARGRQVQIDLDRQRFAAEIIDDIKRAKAPSIPQRIGHEIDRPTTVDLFASHPQRHRMPVWHPLLAAPAAVELHQAIHTPHPLVVPDEPATPDQLEQLVEATLGKPLGQFGQQRDHLLIAIRASPITDGRARQTDRRTGPALAPTVAIHQPLDERALVRRVYSFFAMTSFKA